MRAAPVGGCLDDLRERALVPAFAHDHLVSERRTASCDQRQRAGARWRRRSMNPFAPREVLKVAPIAHRDEGDLSEEGRLALAEAVLASPAPRRGERKVGEA